jgi:hypothetical protein
MSMMVTTKQIVAKRGHLIMEDVKKTMSSFVINAEDE